MDGQDSGQGFLEKIGEAIGEALAWLANSSLGEIWGAIKAFLDGLARGAGLENAGFFTWVIVVVAVLILASGARALLAGRFLGGVLGLVIGVVLLGWAMG